MTLAELTRTGARLAARIRALKEVNAGLAPQIAAILNRLAIVPDLNALLDAVYTGQIPSDADAILERLKSHVADAEGAAAIKREFPSIALEEAFLRAREAREGEERTQRTEKIVAIVGTLATAAAIAIVFRIFS